MPSQRPFRGTEEYGLCLDRCFLWSRGGGGHCHRDGYRHGPDRQNAGKRESPSNALAAKVEADGESPGGRSGADLRDHLPAGGTPTPAAFGDVHDCHQPGGSGHPRGSHCRGDHCVGHGDQADGPKESHRPAPSRRGNLGEYPGDLFRQDRHPDPKQDDRGSLFRAWRGRAVGVFSSPVCPGAFLPVQ